MTTEERRDAIIDLFKKRNYHDSIGMLNQMAQDDKFRVLVDAAFGGDSNEALGNIEVDKEQASKNIASLLPTQSEIDITKSLANDFVISISDCVGNKDAMFFDACSLSTSILPSASLLSPPNAASTRTRNLSSCAI